MNPEMAALLQKYSSQAKQEKKFQAPERSERQEHYMEIVELGKLLTEARKLENWEEVERLERRMTAIDNQYGQGSRITQDGGRNRSSGSQGSRSSTHSPEDKLAKELKHNW